MLIVYFSDDFVYVAHIRKSEVVLAAFLLAHVTFSSALFCRLELLKIADLARFLI
jgi:hypothetical protein